MESCTDVFGFTDTNQVALKLPNDSTSTSTSHRSPSPAKLGTIHTNNLSESTKGSAQLDHRVDNLIGTDNSQSEDSPEKIGFDGYEASADNSLCKEEEVDVGVNEASKPKGSVMHNTCFLHAMISSCTSTVTISELRGSCPSTVTVSELRVLSLHCHCLFKGVLSLHCHCL